MATKRNLTRGRYTGKTALVTGNRAKSRAPIRSGGFDTKQFFMEDVLGVRTPKPGQPQVLEAGIGSGLVKIVAGLFKGSGTAARTTSTAGRAGVKTTKRVAAGAKPAKPAKTVKATKATPAQQYPNLPRTGWRTATGKPYTTAEVRKVAAASGGNYMVAGTAAVVGGAIGISAANGRSGGSTQQKYSGMKPGAEKVRTGPGGSYVGSGMGAKSRPSSSGGAYVGSTVGGNTGSRKKAPSQPSTGGGASRGRTTNKNKGAGGGQSRRTKMVAERLAYAEAAVKRGDLVAATNYAKAAADIQKKGKGSAKSMKRVQRVARTYRRAAGGSTKPATES